MNPEELPLQEGATGEVSALIETLVKTGRRLEDLTAGEVDTVTSRDGRTVMLRRAQDQVRHSESAKQSAILNALPAHIALLDSEGAVVSMNEVWRHFAGVNPLQGPGCGIGVNYLEFCDRALADGVSGAREAAEGIRSVLSGAATSFSVEYACHSPAAQRWFLLTVTPLALDRPNGVVVMHLEITARKQIEQALERRQAEVQVLLDLVPAMIWFKDTENRILRVNKQVARAAGRSVEEIEGKPTLEIYPQDAAKYYADDLEVIRSGMPKLAIVEHFLGVGGGDLWVQTDKVPVRDKDGGVVGVFVMARDITERKRVEQEILDLNVSLERRVAERTLQLEQASRAKSDFLANMSHELRTPLNSIIGFSEMMKDGVLGELNTKQRGFVTDIFDAGTHLLLLINDILDLAKVEAGKLQLDSGALDIAAVLQASTLVVREQALARRIQLDTRLDPGLGIVLADERNLKQIVYNLLSNAVKFTPDGGTVALGARYCARAAVAVDDTRPGRLIALPPGEDTEFLAITVEDSGVGIAEEHLAQLFEPFTQVDYALARRQEGTGLGLSLVRRLAELHGGTVGVTSRPGDGSRFSVWLPRRAAAPAAPAERTMPAGTAAIQRHAAG